MKEQNTLTDQFRIVWEDLLNEMEQEKIFDGDFFNRAAAWEMYNMLVMFYNGPKRYYHTLKHILDMIKNYYQYYKSNSVYNHSIIIFSIIFHDAIYTEHINSEQASALLLFQCCDILGLAKSFKELVFRIILNTKHSGYNKLKQDLDRRIVDLDLMVLASDKDEYNEYCKLIKMEYIHLGEYMYLKGRKKFLEKMLNRERIFYNDMFTNLEIKAKNNMNEELKLIIGEFVDYSLKNALK